MFSDKNKKIFDSIIWLLFENGFRVVFALLLNSLLSRAIGVDGFGALQYVLSLVIVFSSISFICGGEVIVPMLSKLTGRRVENVINNVFCLRFIFCCIAYALLIFFVFIFENSLEIFYLSILLGLSVLVGESFGVVTAWLQANTNSKPRSKLLIFVGLIKCSIVYALYSFNIKDLHFYALVWIFEAYLIAIGLLWIYKHGTGMNISLIKANKQRIYYFLRKGFPFFLSLLCMCLFLRMDILMLRYYSGLEQVGLYGAAFQIVASLSLIAPVLTMSVAPSLVYRLTNPEMVTKRVIYIALVMAIIGAVIAVVMSILSDFIIPFVYGREFISAIPIFNYFVWAMVLYFINEGVNIYLIKLGEGRLLIYKWLVVLVTGVAAYIYFIPKYQAFGAVIGYCVGYISAVVFSSYIMLTRKVR